MFFKQRSSGTSCMHGSAKVKFSSKRRFEPFLNTVIVLLQTVLEIYLQYYQRAIFRLGWLFPLNQNLKTPAKPLAKPSSKKGLNTVLRNVIEKTCCMIIHKQFTYRKYTTLADNHLYAVNR